MFVLRISTGICRQPRVIQQLVLLRPLPCRFHRQSMPMTYQNGPGLHADPGVNRLSDAVGAMSSDNMVKQIALQAVCCASCSAPVCCEQRRCLCDDKQQMLAALAAAVH